MPLSRRPLIPLAAVGALGAGVATAALITSGAGAAGAAALHTGAAARPAAGTATSAASTSSAPTSPAPTSSAPTSSAPAGPTAAPPKAPVPARPDLAVSISRRGVITERARVRPGLVHIVVDGAAGQRYQLVRARHGDGRAVLARELSDLAARRTTPAELDHDFALIGGVDEGGQYVQRLYAGVYFAVDTSTGTVVADHVARLVVTGPTVDTIRPKVTATITATKPTAWAAQPAGIPTDGWLQFVNSSGATQFVAIQQLRSGVTVRQFRHAVSAPHGDPSRLVTTRGTYTAAVAPGHRMLWTYGLPAGRYVLVGYWPNDRTGVPHAANGMVRGLTVG